MEVDEDVESRPHKAVTFLAEGDEFAGDAGVEDAQKPYQDTAVECCQEEARLKEVKKKRKRKGDWWRTR